MTITLAPQLKVIIVIKKPSNAIAIQNRKVAFLYCKECGLIELVEK